MGALHVLSDHVPRRPRRRTLRRVTPPDPVRLASRDDASEAGRLLHEFNTEYDEFTPGPAALADRVVELVEEGRTFVLLGPAADEGVAVVRLRRALWDPAPGALDAYLEELYVMPTRRGRGIGRALLEAVMDEARSRGGVRIELGTSTDDVAAIALYESAGFINEEGPGGPPMLTYERDL